MMITMCSQDQTKSGAPPDKKPWVPRILSAGTDSVIGIIVASLIGSSGIDVLLGSGWSFADEGLTVRTWESDLDSEAKVYRTTARIEVIAPLVDDLQIVAELEFPALVLLNTGDECRLSTNHSKMTKNKFSLVDNFPCKWRQGDIVILTFLTNVPNNFESFKASAMGLGRPTIVREGLFWWLLKYLWPAVIVFLGLAAAVSAFLAWRRNRLRPNGRSTLKQMEPMSRTIPPSA